MLLKKLVCYKYKAIMSRWVAFVITIEVEFIRGNDTRLIKGMSSEESEDIVIILVCDTYCTSQYIIIRSNVHYQGYAFYCQNELIKNTFSWLNIMKNTYLCV